MKILGIETSADDTGVALIEAEGEFRANFRFKILGHETGSQRIHAEYGGIYPNLAKREHAKTIVPLLEQMLREARILKSGAPTSIAHVRELLDREPEIFEHLTKFLSVYERPEIDCIAVTTGPGLEPCLWTGINLARVLSDVWEMPIVGVNHMEGHILVSMMNFTDSINQSTRNLDLRNPNVRNPNVRGRFAKFEFPAIVLLISGGHTELIFMKEFGSYKYLGRTRDDAVGEAFDKVARLLGLPYPGGPQISKLAESARQSSEITSHRVFPRPMIHDDSYDFSFAGLKTAVLRLVETQAKGPPPPKVRPWAPLRSNLASDLDAFKMQIAKEFEDAVGDVLVGKTLRACEEFGASTVIVGGGVSANTHVRRQFASQLEAQGLKLLICPPEYSTDNGVMIALTGYFQVLRNEFIDPRALRANGSLMLAQ